MVFLISTIKSGQNMFMKTFLAKTVEKNRKWTAKGRVATYIPELGKASPHILGITVVTSGGEIYSAGDCETMFTMQSISKPVALMLALMDRGEEYVFTRVGMEPTADRFDSITRLETRHPSKPLNPMINAGAIATTAMIRGDNGEEKFFRLLDLVRVLAENKNIDYNRKVYYSERETGDRNRSLAYFMRASGTIQGGVEDILDLYFRQCAIEVTCRDLATIGYSIARNGIALSGTDLQIPAWIFRLVKTFMVTCGMYDSSGEFAIKVGVPAKSGVSGGIMACIPGKMGIGVIGPALDNKGNSLAGIHVLEDLSREFDLSIF